MNEKKIKNLARQVFYFDLFNPQLLFAVPAVFFTLLAIKAEKFPGFDEVTIEAAKARAFPSGTHRELQIPFCNSKSSQG